MEAFAALHTPVIALANNGWWLYESDYAGGTGGGWLASLVKLGLLVGLYWLFWDR